MKVYTSITYSWQGDELVKTAEESFEYEGPVALAKGGGSTTVVSQPAQLTPEQQQQQALILQEMQRQNTLAQQMLPGQQALIQQQTALIQYQLAHAGDLDAIHSSQLQLAQLQIQQQIADAAMQEQLRPQQLQFLQSQNALALQQIAAMGESTSFQREQNRYVLAGLQDQQARIDARNRHWTPEQEAVAAAEEAARAQRMGGMSEEAARIQLENLRRGGKPTDEQLANINEAYDASQARGESDIGRYLTQTLRQINEETAQAAGLRSTDTPVVRLSERAGEEAARAQGNLTETIAGARASARLNYPLAASQLASQEASTLQGLTQGAANFQDQLRFAADANRNRTFSSPSSVGFAMPPSGPGANLSFMNPGQAGYNPGAFNSNLSIFNTNPSSQTQSSTVPWWQPISAIGSAAGGIGSMMTGWSRMSDARLKTDIGRIGKTDAGASIFRYRYKGDSTPQIGFMAQDVERIFPDAVATHPSGYLMVDYSKVH